MEKVTVIGAGKYGSMTALRIAEYDIVKEVVTVSYTHLTLPTT